MLLPPITIMAMAFTLTSVFGLETPCALTQFERREEATGTVAPSLPSTTMVTFTTTKLIVIEGQTNSILTIPAKTVTLALPTCIQTINPDQNGHVPPGTCGAIWNYYPSYGVALAFTVVFAALVIAHVWMSVKYKKVRT